MLFQWQNKVQRGKPHCPQLRHRFDHLRLCISFLSHQHGCKKRRCPKNSTFFYLVTYIQTREMLLLLFPDLTRPSIVFAHLVPRLGIILRLKGERHSKAMSTNSCFFRWNNSGELFFLIELTVVNLKYVRACLNLHRGNVGLAEQARKEVIAFLDPKRLYHLYSRLTLRILRFLSHKVLGFKISYC